MGPMLKTLHRREQVLENLEFDSLPVFHGTSIYIRVST